MTAAGPWAGRCQGGNGGGRVSLEECQQAGARRGSSQSAANGFQGPLSGKASRNVAEKGPCLWSGAVGLGGGVLAGEAVLHALCVKGGGGGGWMGAAE